tara:strand:+ start:723 stop:2399 length:1677 start_codon:yes stop_codon:yes gene_type:complete
MSITFVSLSDTFDQWRTKNNTVSTDLGEKLLLATSVKTDIVSAINELSSATSRDVVDDTSPELGGNLSLNSNDIDGVGNINITGNITGTIAVGGDLTGTVDSAQIAPNTININELNVSDGTSGQVLSRNSSGGLEFINVTSDPVMGGELSGLASNAQIVPSVIANMPVGGDLTGTIGNAQVVSTTVTGVSVGGDLTGTISNAQVKPSVITGTAVGGDVSGTIGNITIDFNFIMGASVGGDVTGTIADIQIAPNKININELNVVDGMSGQVLSRNSSGELEFINVATGDPTMGGALFGLSSNAQIVAGAVGTTEIASQAVTTAELADGSVNGDKIAASVILGQTIADNSVGIAELDVTDSGNSGDVLSTNGAGVLSFIPQLAGQILNHDYVSLSGFHTAGSYTAPAAADATQPPLITEGFEFFATNYTPLGINTLRIFTDIWGGSGGGGTVFVFATWVTDTVTNVSTLLNCRGYETAVSQNSGDVTMLGWYKPTTTNQLRISFRLGARNGAQCHINSASSNDQDFGSDGSLRGESSISIQEYSGQTLGQNLTATGQTGN